MSIPIRKTVRDAYVTALADTTNGFNAKLFSLETSYSIKAFVIDWTNISPNFAQAQLDPEQAELFHVFREPPYCLVYSTDAVSLPDEGVKYQEFSGQVIINVEFILRYRALTDPQRLGNYFADTNDMESLPDAVEDALFECMYDQKANLNVQGFHWTRRYTSSREPIQLVGDGHIQRLTFAFENERHV